MAAEVQVDPQASDAAIRRQKALARQLSYHRADEAPPPLSELQASLIQTGKRTRRPTTTFNADLDMNLREQIELQSALKNSVASQTSMRQGLRIPQTLVFRPTEEEFVKPMAYINKIRAEAEEYGICKIIPPASFKPPFAHDFSSLRFKTRLQKIHQLQEAIGFDHGGDYSLNEFKQYADEFQRNWLSAHPYVQLPHIRLFVDCLRRQMLVFYMTFDQIFQVVSSKIGLSPDDVSADDIEREYWRIVETSSEPVEIRYGSDINTSIVGSGFPYHHSSTNLSSQLSDSKPACLNHITDEEFKRFASHPWNLNNLPCEPGSTLRYLDTAINGVTQPWMYVGMMFSSFCWHVEDESLYSINYHHFGAPKTWYGVPGIDAEKFNNAMKLAVPKLFQDEPDLMHKLVTQLSPSILVGHQVQVYTTRQEAGEFVITFPKAYHAGFSHGFNCGEAVNFAPVDWFSWGRKAARRYRSFKRETTFSIDLALLRTALVAPSTEMDPEQYATIFFTRSCLLLEELKSAASEEARNVDEAHNLGCKVQLMSQHERRYPAFVPQCHICRSYLFFSYAMCPCSAPESIVEPVELPETSKSIEHIAASDSDAPILTINNKYQVQSAWRSSSSSSRVASELPLSSVNLSSRLDVTCFPLIGMATNELFSAMNRLADDSDTDDIDETADIHLDNPILQQYQACRFYCWSHLHDNSCGVSVKDKMLRIRYNESEWSLLFDAISRRKMLSRNELETIETMLPVYFSSPTFASQLAQAKSFAVSSFSSSMSRMHDSMMHNSMGGSKMSSGVSTRMKSKPLSTSSTLKRPSPTAAIASGKSSLITESPSVSPSVIKKPKVASPKTSTNPAAHMSSPLNGRKIPSSALTIGSTIHLMAPGQPRYTVHVVDSVIGCTPKFEAQRDFGNVKLASFIIFENENGEYVVPISSLPNQ